MSPLLYLDTASASSSNRQIERRDVSGGLIEDLMGTELGISFVLSSDVEANFARPSFVAMQSKLLEKQDFLLRKTSIGDRRVATLTLTDQTRRRISRLAADQKALNEFIFSDFASDEVDELTRRLGVLKKRLKLSRTRKLD